MSSFSVTTPASSSAIRMVDVAGFTKDLDEAAARVQGSGPLPCDPPPGTTLGTWRGHLTDLNTACASAYRDGKEFFKSGGMQFTPDDMEANGRRLADLSKVRDRTADVLGHLDGEIERCKTRMIFHASQFVTSARAKVRDPDTDETTRARMQRTFSPAFAVVDEANALLARTRRENREIGGLIKDLRADSARKDLEMRALRGEKLTVDDVQPTTPRTARRPRRTRR